MGMLVDLGLLAFYALTFIVYVFTTAVQLATSVRDGQISAARFATGLFIRMGLAALFYAPIIGIGGRMVGYRLMKHSDIRRNMILDRISSINGNRSAAGSPTSPRFPKTAQPLPGEPHSRPSPGAAQDEPTSTESAEAGDSDGWGGIIGFFHPFCNAGGGGERVLWAAIKATQEKLPNAVCVVYTGDHDATKSQIITRVKERFNIDLESSKLFFLYLSTRHWVLASAWPRFTLLGQSIGSVVLALDAFQLLVPDIFIDTMGYGFALGCARLLFPRLPTGAYVHYPTISTDMLGSLELEEGKGLHAGAGKGWRGFVKKIYWQLFAWAYSRVGGTVDVVMTNSSWTQAHIQSLWGPYRKLSARKSATKVVFPPCAVEEVESAVAVDQHSERKRENILLYIAQFRPEKNHKMILQAFSDFIHRKGDKPTSSQESAKLVLLGSVRDSEDATRVYELRLLAHELKVKEEVEFVCDASFAIILQWLQRSCVGVNGMWNEHFGIGVVEYQAAGLISVVNNSGGPRKDIVVDYDGGPTGYHASSTDDYAEAFATALELPTNEKIAMRQRARASAKRFTEDEFARGWIQQFDRLFELLGAPAESRNPKDQLIAGSYLLLLAYDFLKIL